MSYKNIDLKKIGEIIVKEREKQGWNQAKLADEAGITAAALCQIEAGSRMPTMPTLRKIANVLNVSLNYLAWGNKKEEIEDMLTDKDIQSFYRDYQSLTNDDKEMIKNQIEFLKSKQRKDR